MFRAEVRMKQLKMMKLVFVGALCAGSSVVHAQPALKDPSISTRIVSIKDTYSTIHPEAINVRNGDTVAFSADLVQTIDTDKALVDLIQTEIAVDERERRIRKAREAVQPVPPPPVQPNPLVPPPVVPPVVVVPPKVDPPVPPVNPIPMPPEVSVPPVVVVPKDPQPAPVPTLPERDLFPTPAETEKVAQAQPQPVTPDPTVPTVPTVPTTPAEEVKKVENPRVLFVASKLPLEDRFLVIETSEKKYKALICKKEVVTNVQNLANEFVAQKVTLEDISKNHNCETVLKSSSQVDEALRREIAGRPSPEGLMIGSYSSLGATAFPALFAGIAKYNGCKRRSFYLGMTALGTVTLSGGGVTWYFADGREKATKHFSEEATATVATSGTNRVTDLTMNVFYQEVDIPIREMAKLFE